LFYNIQKIFQSLAGKFTGKVQTLSGLFLF